MKKVIDSDSKNYRKSCNIGRIVVLNTGFIPRGRAKAPDFTIPKAIVTTNDIQKHIEEIIALIPIFDSLNDNNKYLDHPFFGMLNLAESKKNLIIHTQHHIKIIKDIIKK
jgi:Protein of unknown function (DUF1569)